MKASLLHPTPSDTWRLSLTETSFRSWVTTYPANRGAYLGLRELTTTVVALNLDGTRCSSIEPKFAPRASSWERPLRDRKAANMAPLHSTGMDNPARNPAPHPVPRIAQGGHVRSEPTAEPTSNESQAPDSRTQFAGVPRHRPGAQVISKNAAPKFSSISCGQTQGKQKRIPQAALKPISSLRS